MKIVFLAPFGIRPKGTMLARMIPLAAGLQRHGHRVVIVAPPYTNPEDAGKEETVAGVTVRNIRLGPKNKVVAASLLAWRMFREACAEKPDLVHLFKPKGYGGLAAMLHMMLRGAGLRLSPLFVDADDWEGKGGMNDTLPYSAAEKAVFRLQENWLPPRAAGVTVASRALESRVLAAGIPPERVLYLPNGVDDRPPGDGAKARQRYGIPETAPVILLYTRFFEFGQEKLHYLFAEICRRVADVRFLVVGRGREGEEELLAAAGRDMGFAPALVMAGWVEPAEIPDCLAAADAAIYPFADTLVNRAKCPAKLTELLLAGRPVVADRVGQIAEYIEHGVSGVLCSPDDWEGMAACAAELLLEPERSRQLGEAARHAMLEKFNWERLTSELDAFYGRRMNHPQHPFRTEKKL